MRPDPNENRLKALIDEIRRPYLRELIKNEGLDDVVIICLPLGMESAATPDGRDRVTQCHRCLGPIFCRAYIPEGATLWCIPCAKAELGEDGYEKRAQEELGHQLLRDAPSRATAWMERDRRLPQRGKNLLAGILSL